MVHGDSNVDSEYCSLTLLLLMTTVISSILILHLLEITLRSQFRRQSSYRVQIDFFRPNF